MPAEEPRINISNNQIMLFLGIWAVFTQFKDGISSWAVAKATESANIEKVKHLVDESAVYSASISNMRADIETVKGDIRAEINRSYGADQAHDKTLSFLTDMLKAKPQPEPNAK